MNKQQMLQVLDWADDLAKLYDINVRNVVGRFLNTINYLQSIEKTQRFVEIELQVEYETLMREEYYYDSRETRSNQKHNKTECQIN